MSSSCRARRAEGRAVKVLAELHVDHRRVSAAGLLVPLAVVHVSRLHDRDWLAATLREYSMAEAAWALKCSRTSVRYTVRRVRLVGDRRSQASSGRRCDARRPPVAPRVAGRKGRPCESLQPKLGTSSDRVRAALRASGLPPLAAERVAPGVPAAVRRQVGGSDGSQIVRRTACCGVMALRTDSAGRSWRDARPVRYPCHRAAGETEHPRSLFGHRLAAIRSPPGSTGAGQVARR